MSLTTLLFLAPEARARSVAEGRAHRGGTPAIFLLFTTLTLLDSPFVKNSLRNGVLILDMVATPTYAMRMLSHHFRHPLRKFRFAFQKLDRFFL